ncbi:uncharacterized protein LOC113469670 [Diaphorina citri]|uniref:Uncharacterized protein LOC113469670 n=1 Tax=Diaphorina citri TaxID=121845 RepID=A0A3Q0J8Q4_DIACI|nr:uncharacterized protein LOC113469670 [Diaphorina citri]XP_026683342.1 uncharacterized protein LOC113469670 [Diaphorina citri]
MHSIRSVLFALLAIRHNPTSSHPLTEKPELGLGFRQSTLGNKLTRRLLTVPDVYAMTNPEEMILLHKNTVVQLTKRSTKINKAAMKAKREFWRYNMTSPRYRRTVSPHIVVLNETMTSKEHRDLQFLRWREPFLLKPEELAYYLDLRRKHHVYFPRKCPSCREIVLDTFEQYNFHSFEYDERGYVKVPTPPATLRYQYSCYMCPAECEDTEEMARHYLNHSRLLKKYPTWTYPHTAPATVARRKTSIVRFGSDNFYFDVWPAQDESTEPPQNTVSWWM